MTPYIESDMRDLEVARDIASEDVRELLHEAPDLVWPSLATVAHLLAAALVRVQYAEMEGGYGCLDCRVSEGDRHAEGCLIGRALTAWMGGAPQ